MPFEPGLTGVRYPSVDRCKTVLVPERTVNFVSKRELKAFYIRAARIQLTLVGDFIPEDDCFSPHPPEPQPRSFFELNS